LPAARPGRVSMPPIPISYDERSEFNLATEFKPCAITNGYPAHQRFRFDLKRRIQ
jgi:hypothetical protein